MGQETQPSPNLCSHCLFWEILRARCYPTSLGSSFLQHHRTGPAPGPGAVAAACSSLPSVPTAKSKLSKRNLGKGCKPSSPGHSSHHRELLALQGSTNPFLKYLQTPRSNLILHLGVDTEQSRWSWTLALLSPRVPTEDGWKRMSEVSGRKEPDISHGVSTLWCP